MADDVTALIEAVGSGDATAVQALFARVYDELKVLARKQLRGAAAPTLDTTGLVHEAYLKLARRNGRNLQGRAHFFALAAKAMRQIVIDHARARVAEKRGGADLHVVDLDEAADSTGSGMAADELLRLDDALAQLGLDEPRLAELVELRFFGGLAIAEIALLHCVSERTVNRDWRRAKAQLFDALHPQGGSTNP